MSPRAVDRLRGAGGREPTADDRVTAVLRALYRWSLRLCPSAIRGPMGESMERTFAALCRRARRRRGLAAALGLTAAEILDLARVAWRARTPGGHDGLDGSHPPRATRGEPYRPGPERSPREGTDREGAVAGLTHDVAAAARSLRRQPAFTALAVVTLALGIGAGTAVFSVVDGVVLRSLPFPEPDRIVEIWNQHESRGGYPGLPAEMLLRWRRERRIFERVEGFEVGWRTLTGVEEPEQLQVLAATPGLLDLLGVELRLGRSFTDAEADGGAVPVVLVSEAVWNRRFGGDPGALGTTMRLDGEPHVVVGVLPGDFTFPSRRTQAVVPLALRGSEAGVGRPLALARLRSGLEVERAQEAADAVAAGLRTDGILDPGWGIRLWPLEETYIYRISPAVERGLLVLLGAVGLVVLITCANLAHLLLARSAGRRRELAVRSALGAGPGRLVRQLLLESGLLSVTGCGLGVLLARWSVPPLVALAPERLNFLFQRPIEVDQRVLLVAVGASLLTALLSGVVPALRGARAEPAAVLAGGRGQSATTRSRRLRAGLVVAEVTLALILLVGAGLMVRSLGALLRVDPGFQPRDLTVVTLSPGDDLYPDLSSWRSTLAELERAVSTLPGVSAGAVATGAPPLPGGLTSASSAEVEGGAADGASGGRAGSGGVEFIGVSHVGDDYFEAMGIPLKAGRGFAPGDAAAGAVVLSEHLARRFWGDRSPLGRRIRFGGGRFEEVTDAPDAGEPWLTVVGVAPDVLQAGLDDEAGEMDLYLPLEAADRVRPVLFLLLRTGRPLDVVAPGVRQRVRAVDRDLPITAVEPMEDVLLGDLAGPRFHLTLMSLFAGVAAVLAALGIYGVMAYSVTQRRREIGIRMALGAAAGETFRRVVADGVLLAGIGVALGLVGAWWLSTVVSSMLHGIPATDPMTYGVVTCLVMGVALLASAIPARRATRVDPLETLRDE